MSRQVLFNGAVLTRPGAYTKIDASQFSNIALLGIGIVGLIGDADGGQPRIVQAFNSSAGVKAFYRSGPLVEAASIVADPSSDDIIVTGAQSVICYKTNNSTQSTLTHDTAFVFKSRDWGLHTNSIQIAITSSAGSLRTAQITGLDSTGNLVSELSPEFGDPAKFGKFAIQYVGAGSACTMTITDTTLTTTVTGGPGGENLNISFSQYANLGEILFFIDGLAAYTATALITNAQTFDPSNLDALAGVDIRTTPRTVMSNNFDMANWITSFSTLVSCTLVKNQTGPRTVLAKTALAGGARGTSANADWVAGFSAISGIRVNQVVPLASRDAVAAEGTYTIAAINAALSTHCKLMSSTVGKSERQGWASINATKANLILAAQALNSEHVCLSGQKLTRQSAVTANFVQMEEWSFACALAGMRAGAPIGEPLTHKLVNASAIANDSSWNPDNPDDVVDLLLNGIVLCTSVLGRGIRIERGITTYTKSDNDAFTEESLVQCWKFTAFEWRTALERRYTGRPLDAGTVKTVKPFSITVLTQIAATGAITESIVNGVTTPGFGKISVSAVRDVLSVSGEISPTPGVNFILNTATLVPAQFSL